MIKVSIIVPVYNTEKYLEKCLKSLVEQTLKEIEIICINDGSTDGSLEILNEYALKDSRIHVFSQENAGLSATRNRGIKLAQGEFIGFVDSDDWVSLDFYEKLYKTAKKYQADVAVTNICQIDEDGTNRFFIKYRKEATSKKAHKKYNLAHIPDYNYVWNRIYDRVKLQKMNVLFEEGILFEDILFSHKVIFYMQYLVTVPNACYYYRNNKYSIVNVDTEYSKKHLYMECYRALKFVQDNNIYVSNYNKHCNYKWDTKKEYCIFGLPILTIKKYQNDIFYDLFGLIPIFSKRIHTRSFDTDKK